MFGIGYASLYEAQNVWWYLALVLIIDILTIFASQTLNYDFSDAIVTGAALGTLSALLCQYFVYVIIVPSFPILLRNRWLRVRGYVDTYTAHQESVCRKIVDDLRRRFPENHHLTNRQALEEAILEYETEALSR